MNDNMNVGSIVFSEDEYKVVNNTGTLTAINPKTLVTASSISASTITTRIQPSEEDLMDKWIMNRITIDHKVQEQELLKLKEVAPDYANEIKENLAKNASRDIMKKLTFTKKHDKDADVHHFIGRVWCFTEQELKEFIKEVRNA